MNPEYRNLYDKLLASGAFVASLGENWATKTSNPATRVVSLRHDVDLDLDTAVKLAEFEHSLGIRSSYFLLHTAGYWHRPRAFRKACKRLLSLGHEIGLHNNLITSYILKRNPAWLVDYLCRCLKRLRDTGASVIGTSCHGDSACYKYGYFNYEIWTAFNQKKNEGLMQSSGFRYGRRLLRALPKLNLNDFGLSYEAYFLDLDFYMSDSDQGFRGIRTQGSQKLFERTLNKRGRKGMAVLDRCLRDGGHIEILVHPIYCF